MRITRNFAFLMICCSWIAGCDLAPDTESTRSEIKALADTKKDDDIVVDNKKKEDKDPTPVVKASCGDIAHGGKETKVFYKNATEPFGTACQQEASTRLCEDGTFKEWSSAFQAQSCTVAAPLACTGTSGSVAHGDSEPRIAYAALSVPFGQQCQPQIQTRVCQNGSFSSWSGGNYTHLSCTVQNATACVGDSTRIRYKKDPVAFNESCEFQLQNRSCNNGSWGNWSGTFTHTKCDQTPPASCDGIAHLGQQTRSCYAAAKVPAGSTCSKSDQVRTCSNGTWQAWSSASCPFSSCSVLPPAVSNFAKLISETALRIDFENYIQDGGASISFTNYLTNGRTVAGSSSGVAPVAGHKPPGLGFHFDSGGPVADSAKIPLGAEVLDYYGLTITTWIKLVTPIATPAHDCDSINNPALRPECRVYYDNYMTRQILYHQDKDPPYRVNLDFGFNADAKMRCKMTDFAGQSAIVYSDTPIPANKWVNIGVVLDHSKNKLAIYIDGKLDSVVDAPIESVNISSGDLRLAHRYYPNERDEYNRHIVRVYDFGLSGSMDDTNFWSRPLTPEEMKVISEN